VKTHHTGFSMNAGAQISYEVEHMQGEAKAELLAR
jgi:hypothetical protein